MPHENLKGEFKVALVNKLPTARTFRRRYWCDISCAGKLRDKHEEFGEAYRIASGLQKAFLMELSAAGIGTGAVALMLQVNHHKMRLEKEEENQGNETIQKVVVEAVGASQHKGD